MSTVRAVTILGVLFAGLVAATSTTAAPVALPLSGFDARFHFDSSSDAAGFRCDPALEVVAGQGANWSGIHAVASSGDGYMLRADQSYVRNDVAGDAIVSRNGSSVYRFRFLLLVQDRGGAIGVLAVVPKADSCAPQSPLGSGHTYAARWTLAARNGGPSIAEGSACVTLTPSGTGYDVTVEAMSCVAPNVVLRTSARAGIARQRVSLARFERVLDSTAPSSATQLASQLHFAPIVVGAAPHGDALTLTLTRDSRRLAPCPRLGGEVAAVWELGGRHVFGVTAANAAGSASARAVVSVTTQIGAVAVNFDAGPGEERAAAQLALATARPERTVRRILADMRRLLAGAGAAPGACPKPGR